MKTSQLTKKEWLVLVAAVLGSGIAFLDGTVVNVAIPTIQKFFATDLGSVLWVVNAFSLMEACLLLVSGSLSDRLGRKRLFVSGMVLFVISSIACGFSNSIGILIVFRAMQGVGSAMMIPGSLSLISTNTAPERRNKAIGLWSGISGAFGIVGPFVGGFIVQHFSWRMIFFINVPLGLLAIAVALYFVPESKSKTTSSIDWRGAVLVFLGLLGVSYALMSVPDAGWGSLRVLSCLTSGVVLFSTFIYTQLHAATPLLPLQIFKRPLVAGANLMTFLLYFALNSTFFFLMLNLQQIQKFSPLQAGLATLPAVLVITFLSGSGGTFADRYGPRLPLIAGQILVAAGIGLLLTAGADAHYFYTFFPALILFGLGMALVIAPITNSALSVSDEYSGVASGVNNAITGVSALLAIAVLGALVVPIFTMSLHERLQASSLTARQQEVIFLQSPKFGAIEVPFSFGAEAQAAATHAVTDSFVFSFRVMMGINVTLALMSAGVAALFIQKKRYLI